jgi:hypothetical protein
MSLRRKEEEAEREAGCSQKKKQQATVPDWESKRAVRRGRINFPACLSGEAGDLSQYTLST